MFMVMSILALSCMVPFMSPSMVNRGMVIMEAFASKVRSMSQMPSLYFSLMAASFSR